ncbi:MAG: M1 family aminopeptidase [Chitinophagaceae bacterium]
MRILLFTLLIIPSIISNAQGGIDVLHYQYEIGLNDSNDTINGKALITFIFNEPGSSASFDLAGIKNERGMKVISASFVNRSSQVPVIGHVNDKLIIQSPGSYKKGDTAAVYISYKGIPSDGLIISKNKYGHRTFFADNWPNRGHNWLPCVDDPADKASVDFIVTTPQHYQVVANGILVEETNLSNDKKLTHWKEDVAIATKVMVIGVADFAVSLAGTLDNCIPVYSWVYPEEKDKGFYDYAQAMEILPFFIKNVGPYGYKKLANVQSKTTFGGLENANTIFYHENSIDGTRKSETLLSHEIAHQWFGNMATEKSFAHLWLSEGFATYMTVLYMENKHGADTARKMLEDDRLQVIEFAKTSDRSIVDETKDPMELLNANSYQKGGWVLHMLRRQLGDSIFWKSVRSYYAAYAGKNADTKDLQSIFEKISGKNLSAFFQQWLYTPGVPKLEVSWSYLPGEKKISLTIKQLQKTPFSFPLDLQLKNNTETKTLNITKQEETFVIAVKEKPVKLVLDPNTSLLFTSTIIEKK